MTSMLISGTIADAPYLSLLVVVVEVIPANRSPSSESHLSSASGPQHVHCRPHIPVMASESAGAPSTEEQGLASPPLPQSSPPLPQWMMFGADADTKTPVSAQIIGTIPKWLNGSLYRNGPGIYQIGETCLEHLLDGFSVLHRYIIHDGEVQYQSHVLESEAWTSSGKANRLVVSQFATYASPDPCKSFLSKVVSFLSPLSVEDLSDNTAINIVQHGDKLFAMTDMSVMNEVDPQTLLVKNKVELHKLVPVHMVTAHPHFSRDGKMYNLGTSINPSAAYSIFEIFPQATLQSEPQETQGSVKAQLLVTIPSQWNMHVGYSHSFGMSQNYFIVLEQPMALNILKVVTMNWRREGLASCFTKLMGEKMVFRVIQRSDKRPLSIRFETDSTFCFHFVNCFEDHDGQLVVDLCCYDDVDLVEDLYLKKIRDHTCNLIPSATLRRYVLPVCVEEAGPEDNLVSLPYTTATAHMISPGVIHCTPDYISEERIVLELPQIHYKKFNATKYRYVYGASANKVNKLLVKVDLAEKRAIYWMEPGFFPGEPVFVAKPDAEDEDEGKH
ncbi:hypothetical protein C0Q70_16581 [Pomacea canaliculata]|uniref:Uncharacterized protein n=1 Tax=Pomacea canaliculata TaxID=400727 RepID=A0A2T7NQ91_POMCA|nr:hypothetical protein C0Q70_16581 [Pomacea canaliculata]